MKSSPLVLALAFGLLLADSAMAQSSRTKDNSRRVTPREPAAADRDAGRRDRSHETTSRRPIRETVHTNRPREDDRTRDRGLWDRSGRVIFVLPGGRHLDRYGYDTRYGYDMRYGRDLRYRSGSISGAGAGHVWNRRPGMTCLELHDELEWAHDEWHYRHDDERDERWYEAEHARLEWRIAEERAYSGCPRAHQVRACSDRGRYPLAAGAHEVAVLVLSILMRDGVDRLGY
ncbi:MAG TPA: hypothetical protein VMN78_05835 [Longimicrobiales bacterium]|nr:hypothetical protein [Longimicrobiales bacterium]